MNNNNNNHNHHDHIKGATTTGGHEEEADEELQQSTAEDKMSSSYLYAKGARVWIKHPEEVWQIATVSKDYDKSAQLVVAAEASGEVSVSMFLFVYKVPSHLSSCVR